MQANRINIALFYNHERGYELLKYFLKKKQKKNFKIKNIFLSEKNLNKKTLLKTKKFNPIIINNVNSKLVESEIKKNKIDVILVGGFPYILKKKVFALPKIGSINLHGGPLPKYRGGSPLNWQIINNEKYIGLSAIKINEGIDTGEIILQKKFKLKLNDDINSVHKKANKIFPLLAKEAIKKLKNKVQLRSQTKKNNTYFKQRSKKDGKIKIDRASSFKTFNLIRAITKPYPGAFCFDDYGKEVILYKSSLCKNYKKNQKIGQIIIKNKFPIIKLKRGCLRILKSSRKLKNNEILK